MAVYEKKDYCHCFCVNFRYCTATCRLVLVKDTETSSMIKASFVPM